MLFLLISENFGYNNAGNKKQIDIELMSITLTINDASLREKSSKNQSHKDYRDYNGVIVFYVFHVLSVLSL